MFRRYAREFSTIELDYLKTNRASMSVEQLSLALSQTRNGIKRKLDELDGKKPPTKGKGGKRTKIGKRDDILVKGKALFLRSGWEANVCRYLNHKGLSWEYEPHVFFFEGVRRGTNSYCPDLKVKSPDIWLEIKGNIDGKGRAAIRRFKKHFPEEFSKLKVIVGRPGTKADKFFKEMNVPIFAYYNELDKKYKNVIPNWE